MWDFALGCPLIEDSYAVEPTAGILLASASCLERWGKLRLAEARYRRLVDEIARLDAKQTSYRAKQVAFARAAITA